MPDVLLLTLVAIAVIVVAVGSALFVHSSASRQLDSLTSEVNVQLDKLGRHLRVLEVEVRQLQSGASERQASAARARLDTAPRDGEAAEEPRRDPLTSPSAFVTGQPSSHQHSHQQGDRWVGTDARPATAVPVNPRAEFERQAAESLTSVASFTGFVGRYDNGSGYVLDPAGISSVPTPLQGPADKADLWVFVFPEHREVFAGFNLRRNVALYAGDAGRPAEARLGWLFDIAAGEDIRVHEPAHVGLADWTVTRKGRLTLPL